MNNCPFQIYSVHMHYGELYIFVDNLTKVVTLLALLQIFIASNYNYKREIALVHILVHSKTRNLTKLIPPTI